MNNRIKIVADDKIPFLQGVLEPYCDIEYYPGAEITNERVIDADALIVRTRTNCNSDLLENTNVKLITTATIGFDHIDSEYCNNNTIKWLNAPGCNSSSVKQYITSALLTLANQQEINLSKKTIGIVGVGNVGSKIKEVAEVLGMKVLLNDPPRARAEIGEEFCDLDTIINKSDIITFHVPLNRAGIDKTHHLANELFFNKLRKKPIILNSSRGEVIKTSALRDAIINEKVSAVVLDVWEKEPNIDLELLELVNIASPHIAGYSADGKANGTSVCVNSINSYFNLGIEANWYPNEIPNADDGNEITIECENKSNQEIIYEVVKRTYEILNDDETLRNSPHTFEKQRGRYPIRREFNNYKILLKNSIKDIKEKLQEIGFKIEIIN